MATKLEKNVTREVTINGVDFNITMGPEGVEYKAKGKRTGVTFDHATLMSLMLNASDASLQKFFNKLFE